MTQQGERDGPDRQEQQPDWWSQLYDEKAGDTGRSAAGDTLDDRVASALRALSPPPATPSASHPHTPVPSAADEQQPAPGPQRDGGPGVPLPASGNGRAPTAGRLPSSPASEPAPGVPPSVPGGGPGAASPGGAPPSPTGGVPAAPPASAGRGPVPKPGPPVSLADPGAGGRMALPAADPDELSALVPDTELDGARYGSWALHAGSVRGEAARQRGEPRGDALLTARFGSGPGALLLVAVATGRPGGAAAAGAAGAHRAARAACRLIGGAVGRSHARLVRDIRAARRSALKSGLHRLTSRGYGKLRAQAAEPGPHPADCTVDLRCLLLPADPACRIRVFFGVGAGGLFRLRDGAWQDIEPRVPEADPAGGPVLGRGAPPDPRSPGGAGPAGPGALAAADGFEPADTAGAAEPFRFRASVARPGDTLLLCSAGLAEPLRTESTVADRLAAEWAGARPPGPAAFLAAVERSAVGGAADRTAAAVWES